MKVGAFVEILKCKQCPERVGTFGLVTNTAPNNNPDRRGVLHNTDKKELSYPISSLKEVKLTKVERKAFREGSEMFETSMGHIGQILKMVLDEVADEFMDSTFQLELAKEVVMICRHYNLSDKAIPKIYEAMLSTLANETTAYAFEGVEELIINLKENVFADLTDKFHKCGFCQRIPESPKRCPCFNVTYCNEECQKKHWKVHKEVCDKKKKKKN